MEKTAVLSNKPNVTMTSFAAVQEAMELEYNQFSSIVDSINTLNEASLLEAIDTASAKKVFIEKIRSLIERIKNFLKQIKVKLIDGFKNVISKRIIKSIDKVEAMAKKGQLKEGIESFKIATISLGGDSKEVAKTAGLEALKAADEKVKNAVNSLEQMSRQVKFLIDDPEILKQGKEAIEKEALSNTTATSLGAQKNDSIVASQQKLKDCIQDKFGGSTSFKLQYHEVEVPQSASTSNIVKRFASMIRTKINKTSELSKLYIDILKKESTVERSFNKILSVIGAAKYDGRYSSFGSLIRDDINILKLEANVFSGIYSAYIKELMANTAQLFKFVAANKDKEYYEKELKKAAEKEAKRVAEKK